VAALFGLAGVLTLSVFALLARVGGALNRFSDGSNSPSARNDVGSVFCGVVFLVFFGAGIWGALSQVKKTRKLLAGLAYSGLGCVWLWGAFQAHDIGSGMLGMSIGLLPITFFPTLLWLWLFSPGEEKK
jgi:hypothetical protein